jgi:hypothetical protein
MMSLLCKYAKNNSTFLSKSYYFIYSSNTVLRNAKLKPMVSFLWIPDARMKSNYFITNFAQILKFLSYLIIRLVTEYGAS